MTKEEIDGLIAELENQLKDLEAKRTGILEKLKGLKHIQNDSAVSESASELKVEAGVSRAFSVGPKITLFRSLFKGREDLYARRWESLRTGKSGYQPVCKNDWIRGVCRKPEIKCGECAAREFVPLTDNVIQHHLFGFYPADRTARRSTKDFIIGIYPLLQDETCWFLAADFDKESWRADISAYCDTCCRFNVPLAVERSR